MDFPGKQIKQEQMKDTHYCNLCPFGTRSLFSIINHVKRHTLVSSEKIFSCSTKLPLYQCLDCDFHTHLMVEFDKHVKLTHPLTPQMETEETSRRFQNKFELSEILRGYSCSSCNFQTSSILMLMRHCLDCIKNQNNRNGSFCKKKKTLDTSNKIDWYYCDRCLYKSKKKSGLKDHVLFKHTASEQIEWFCCQNCPFKGKRKGDLNRHMLQKHTSPENTKWYECEHCAYRSKHKIILKQHITQNHVSDYTSKQKPNLKQQPPSGHTCPKKIDWYICDHCPYKSKLGWVLRQHVLRKHAAPETLEWYHCAHCSYKAKVKSALTVHNMRIHTPSEDCKWFYCEQCPYKSKIKYNLTDHVRGKHTAPENMEWYPCHHCSYKAKWRSNLKAHIVAKHTAVKTS